MGSYIIIRHFLCHRLSPPKDDRTQWHRLSVVGEELGMEAQNQGWGAVHTQQPVEIGPPPPSAPLPLPGAPQTPQGQSPAGLGTQPSWQEALSKGVGIRETRRRARCPTLAPHLPSCLERPRPGNGVWRTSLELNEEARAIKGSLAETGATDDSGWEKSVPGLRGGAEKSKDHRAERRPLEGEQAPSPCTRSPSPSQSALAPRSPTEKQKLKRY